MIKKVIETAVIDDADAKRLEKAWYGYQGMNDLIRSGVTDNLIVSRYEANYFEYNKTWADILKKYFEKDYTSTGRHSWGCDFTTRKVTITEG